MEYGYFSQNYYNCVKVGVLGKTHDKLEEGGIGIFGFAVLAIF